MTFSFVRGDVADATAQKAISTGTVVMRAKNRVVLRPPPTFHDTHAGTRMSNEIKSTLEKLSLPGPSAGRGGLLIAGDFDS